MNFRHLRDQMINLDTITRAGYTTDADGRAQFRVHFVGGGACTLAGSDIDDLKTALDWGNLHVGPQLEEIRELPQGREHHYPLVQGVLTAWEDLDHRSGEDTLYERFLLHPPAQPLLAALEVLAKGFDPHHEKAAARAEQTRESHGSSA